MRFSTALLCVMQHVLLHMLARLRDLKRAPPRPACSATSAGQTAAAAGIETDTAHLNAALLSVLLG